MEKEKDFLKIHIPPTFGILHTCLIQWPLRALNFQQ
jgi:hypothetical protein